MIRIVPQDIQFDFVGKRRIWLGVSGFLVACVLILFFTRGLHLGIDFKGGSEVHVRVPQNWPIGKLRTGLEKTGFHGVKIQQVGDASQHEFLLRIKGEPKELQHIGKRVEKAFKKLFLKAGSYEVLQVDVVGPVAGKILRRKGLLAMFYALLVILIYVAIRFDSRYAPGAVIALFHDSMMVLGIFILTQKQFDLTVLAAILALIGYSNNDTIIVYDRIREVLQLHPDWKIEKAVNQAINNTLGRTLMTSITTFLVVMALWLLGSSVIENFCFALLCGVVVGTYSSVFIASSFIVELTLWNQKKKRLAYRS